MLGSVFALSPVLKTLTDSISTDTIYAMTVSTAKIRVITYNLKPSLRPLTQAYVNYHLRTTIRSNNYIPVALLVVYSIIFTCCFSGGVVNNIYHIFK